MGHLRNEMEVNNKNFEEFKKSLEDITIYNKLMLYAQNTLFIKEEDKRKDYVQETFLKALRSYHTFTLGTNLLGRLKSIMKSLFLTEYHKKGKEVLMDNVSMSGLLEKYGIVVPHERDLQIQKMRSQLYEAMEGMEILDKNVVLLRILGYKEEEVAAILDMNLNTVKTKFSRSKKYINGNGH